MILVWRSVEPSSLIGKSLFPGVPALYSPVSRHHKARYTNPEGISVEKSQVWVTFVATWTVHLPSSAWGKRGPRAEQHKAGQASRELLTHCLLPLPSLMLGLVPLFLLFSLLCAPLASSPCGCGYHGIHIYVFMYTTHKPVLQSFEVPTAQCSFFPRRVSFPPCALCRAIQSAVTR